MADKIYTSIVQEINRILEKRNSIIIIYVRYAMGNANLLNLLSMKVLR
jgi:hypothetical protein